MKQVNNYRTARLKPLLGLFILLSGTLTAQHHDSTSEKYATAESCQPPGQFVSLLFWNVENLFDYRDDSLTIDEDFTASGSNHWTFSKLQTKTNKLAKTILAAGEWDPPAIIGLCEIENRYVLNKLVYSSPLAPFRYRIIHRNSPDQRGIDVAMIYRDTLFVPVYSRWIPVRFPFDTTVRTRDILYVKGILCGADTLHLFVNHWPSRRGGEQRSAPRRNYVAALLRSLCDSIIEVSTHIEEIPNVNIQKINKSQNPKNKKGSGVQGFSGSVVSDSLIPDPISRIPYVLLMGDFNDEPDNVSLSRVLGAVHPDSVGDTTRLVNLMYPKLHKEGSHKFRDHWGLLDQFIVSVSLLASGENGRGDSKGRNIYGSDGDGENDHRGGNDKKNDSGDSDNRCSIQGKIAVDRRSVTIFRPGFLVQEDVRYLDIKPSRTYVGPRYLGGFSDHLPVILQLEIRR